MKRSVGLRPILSNLKHLIGGKSVAGLLSLAYLVIVARALGATEYGILILIHGYVLLIGGLVAFSGFHGLVRYGALALGGSDPARLARIARLMALIEMSCGLAAIAIAMLLVPLVGPRLGWSPDAVAFAVPYCAAIIAGVRATPQGLLQLAGRFDLIGLHQTVSPLVRLTGALLVSTSGGGLTEFLLVWLVAAAAESVAMWLFAWRSWRRLCPGEPLLGPWKGVAKDNDGFIRFIVSANVDISLRELTPNLAPLTIGWLLDPAAAGLFGLVQRATAVLRQPAILLSQASYAVLVEFAARRDVAGLLNIVWRIAGLTLAISVPILAALALFGASLLTLLGGDSFADGAMLLLLVAAARALALGFAPVTTALTALGLPQRSIATALVSDVALYPLLPLLLMAAGVEGAGLQLLLQGGVAAVLATLFLVRAAGSDSQHAPAGGEGREA